MKKFTAILIALLMLLAVTSGCTNKDHNNKEENEKLYDFDMTEYIEVPKLSDITVSLADIEKEWQYAALKVRLDNTYYEMTNDPDAVVSMYDKVLINYNPLDYGDGTLTNEHISMLSGKNLEITVGSGNFIPAYESVDDPSKNTEAFDLQLLGKKSGVNITVNVTFPDNYSYIDGNGIESFDLAGVKVAFDTKIVGIYKGDLPELTDELVKSYSSDQYQTVSAYKDYIYEYFKGTYAYEAFSKQAELKGSLPEKELESARLNYLTNKINAEFGDKTPTDDEIRALYELYFAEANEYATKAVFDRMVLEYLFSECKITLSDDEYVKKLTEDYNKSYYIYYVNYGVTTMSEYEDYFGYENLLLQYKYQMLLEVLVTKVNITA